MDINFQIFSQRILPKATTPKAENGGRIRTKDNEPLKLGLTREPITLEKKLNQEERNSAFLRGENRVKTQLGFSYTNNCGRKESVRIEKRKGSTRNQRCHENVSEIRN